MRGPGVGEAGSIDSLEAWARPYYERGMSPRASSHGPPLWLRFSPGEARCLVKLALRCGADVDGIPSMASTAAREEGARLLLLACRQNDKNLKAAVTCLLEAKERVAGGQESALEDAVKQEQQEEEDGVVTMTTTTPPTGVDGRDEPEEEVPGVVDYLLYQLYMAEPREFVKCVGSEADRELLPLLAEQFVMCAPPVPSEAGRRGPGFAVAVAAHALAGIGLTTGERGAGGRRRAAVAAAGHLGLLTDVARRFPLVFLEQVVALTEVLLTDAEVERSVAALQMDGSQPSAQSSNGTGNISDGFNVSAGAGAAPAVFRSRRTVPGRLCPVPAEMGSAVFDAEGRPVGMPGSTVLVHVRMWGQFFTDILWGGVLSALRAAPLDLLSGSAGVNAGVPSLLEAFLNLVAVQMMIDHGPEIAPLATSLKELLQGLGRAGESLLRAMPPAGGRMWSSAKDMLQAVPPVEP
ncbi:unnamed protein product [Sphacelaria rigidula]